MIFERSVQVPRPRGFVVAASVLAVIFTGGIVLVPLLEAARVPGGSWLASLYAPLCHRMPSRSLSILGNPLAVCARCLGLYVAGTAALVVAAARPWVCAIVRPPWLAVASIPTLADVLLHVLGWEGLSNMPRLFVALPAGFVAGLFLARGLADLADLTRERRASRREAGARSIARVGGARSSP